MRRCRCQRLRSARCHGHGGERVLEGGDVGAENVAAAPEHPARGRFELGPMRREMTFQIVEEHRRRLAISHDRDADRVVCLRPNLPHRRPQGQPRAAAPPWTGGGGCDLRVDHAQVSMRGVALDGAFATAWRNSWFADARLRSTSEAVCCCDSAMASADRRLAPAASVAVAGAIAMPVAGVTANKRHGIGIRAMSGNDLPDENKPNDEKQRQLKLSVSNNIKLKCFSNI